MKKVISWFAISIMSVSGFSAYGMGKVIPKKTPMQTPANMAYCWTPDGKIAFYRLIDHWIKMEPDPFPGGGGVYDDYKKDDEAFIVVRDPETKEEKVLFKVPFKGAAAPIQYMDWSGKREEILLSTGLLVAIKPDGSNFRVVMRKEGGYCGHGIWSPDGKQILYAYLPFDARYISEEYITKMIERGENPGLYIVNTDGTSERLLVENGMNGSWSPDGKQVVYQTITRRATEEDFKRLGVDYLYSTRDIYIINADGTGKRLLVENGANPIWSPDGKWILCGGKLITPDGKFIADIEVPGSFSRWSPDMKYLLSLEGIIQEFKIEGR